MVLEDFCVQLCYKKWKTTDFDIHFWGKVDLDAFWPDQIHSTVMLIISFLLNFLNLIFSRIMCHLLVCFLSPTIFYKIVFSWSHVIWTHSEDWALFKKVRELDMVYMYESLALVYSSLLVMMWRNLNTILLVRM